MKRLLGLLTLFLVGLTLCGIGCKDEDEPQVTPPPTPLHVGQVEIVLSEDTLYAAEPNHYWGSFFSVIVYDQNGATFPGIKVNISSPTGAQLEFADSVRQDTTNDSGRVEVIYRVDEIPDLDSIFATAENAADSAQIVVCQLYWEIPSLNISVLPSELHLTTADSALVSINLNNFGWPIVNAVLGITTNGGSLDDLPPTDSLGNASTYWHPADTGLFWVSATYLWTEPCRDLLFIDTAWVTVIPPEPGAISILVVNDTLRFVLGDTASTSVAVILIDQEGHTIPGRRVNMSLSNPSIGFLQFMDPMLMDTTNEQGRINLRFSAWAYGTTQIIAANGDVSAMKPVVCMAP